MMIELGEADVFKGQVAQLLESLGDGGAAIADFIEQRFNLGAIHQRLLCGVRSLCRCAWLPA